MELSVRDIDLLQRFQQLTPYNTSISERVRRTNFAESHRSAVWRLYALEARTKLNELGLPYGRKSKNVAPPRVEFSERDYLRGLFDADGSLGHSQGCPFISLATASTHVMAYLCSYAEKITGTKRNLRRNQRDGVYNVMYVTEAAQTLVAHLYYPGCLALKRKQTTAASIAEWARPVGSKPRPPRIQWTRAMDQVLLAAPTVAHAATELGYSFSACQGRRWKLLHGVVTTPD
ncbi:LAGLIDADG family homing endonuclease [Streptomyces sp. DH10]|uniref:LAGLIDADG family homing endonuclease n=1 Tax=Streptomyces sp. DH10 TaxID=3040121 RepID=UPI003014FFBB